MQADLPAAEQVRGLRAGPGVVTFAGPQGRGFLKGGHDDYTANTMVCVARGRRCVVILASDVRNDGVRVGIDASLQTKSGTLMLAIQWPISRPATHTQLMQLGGSVSAHFRADKRIRKGATCLRVVRDADCMQPYREGANHVVIVRVPWSTT